MFNGWIKGRENKGSRWIREDQAQENGGEAGKGTAAPKPPAALYTSC